MTDMSNVTVTITQGGTTIAVLTTDTNGECGTVLNAGTYTVSFSYAGRSPVSHSIVIASNNTLFFFVFPNYVIASCNVTATMAYDNDVSGATSSHTFTATNVFTNT